MHDLIFYISSLDILNEGEFSDYFVDKLLENPDIDPDMLYQARIVIPQLDQTLNTRLGIAIRAGNHRLGSSLLEAALKTNGFGYNELHLNTLKAKKVADLGDVKRVSITKKTYGSFLVTPLHAACINPNPLILDELLKISQQYNFADEILRKPVHYAATCEGPGPLKVLIDNGADTR